MKKAIKMVNPSTTCFYIVLIYCVLWVTGSFPSALSCDSCGRECASACGTRHFRTCCFNYLRKRSSTPPVAPPQPPMASPRGLNLEMWLAKARLEQAEHLNHRHQSELLAASRNSAPGVAEPSGIYGNEVDYIELRDINSGLGATSHGGSSSNGGQAMGKFRLQRPLDEQIAHEIDIKSSEESDPGRLQLLYEA